MSDLLLRLRLYASVDNCTCSGKLNALKTAVDNSTASKQATGRTDVDKYEILWDFEECFDRTSKEGTH